MPLSVLFGIPEPVEQLKGDPQFKSKGVTTLRLSDFPENDLPSGGLTGRISASEMFMVSACRPVTMTWKDQVGKVLLHAHNIGYSFIGRFPWEITLPGIYECGIEYKGVYQGKVEFEVT